jgi:hypothetical protein
MSVIGRSLASTIADMGILRPTENVIDGSGWIVGSRGVGNKPLLQTLIASMLAANGIGLGGDLLGGVANSGTTWAALAAGYAGLPWCNVLVDGP